MSHFQLGAKTRTSVRKKLGSVSNAGAMAMVLHLSDPDHTLYFPDQSVITGGEPQFSERIGGGEPRVFYDRRAMSRCTGNRHRRSRGALPAPSPANSSPLFWRAPCECSSARKPNKYSVLVSLHIVQSSTALCALFFCSLLFPPGR